MQEASERLGQLTRPEDPAQAGTHTGGTAPDAGGRQEDFEELIRGRYKADFDARVKKILDGRLRGLRQEVTDLRQREKLRQVQIQYYLDRLPEQEKQVRMVHPEFRLQKEMENPRFFRLVQAGVEPRDVPIRGGTDGARLSYLGLPCPNLSTGGYHFHGVYEYIPVESLEKMTEMLVHLLTGIDGTKKNGKI